MTQYHQYSETQKKEYHLAPPKPTSMLHLNGNLLAVMDVETTGLKPGYHDLIQICVLIADAQLKPYLKIPPFYCEIQPKRPENCNDESLTVNRQKLCNVMINGIEPYKAADLFDDWFERKICLPFGKKLSPLAQNWPFDRGFIIDWLGDESFTQYFDGRYRDTMVAALFENDKADFRVEQVAYPKVNLGYLASVLKIEHERAHDALQDCIVTLEVYRRMILRGFTTME